MDWHRALALCIDIITDVFKVWAWTEIDQDPRVYPVYLGRRASRSEQQQVRPLHHRRRAQGEGADQARQMQAVSDAVEPTLRLVPILHIFVRPRVHYTINSYLLCSNEFFRRFMTHRNMF